MLLLVTHLLQCQSKLASCDGFSGEAVGEKYLLHLPSVYGFKCIGEVDEIYCCLKFFLLVHFIEIDE